MPVARGTSTVTVNNSDVPADYIIHHSGHQSSPDGPTTSHRTLTHDIEQQDNPTWWPTDHRRVPNYRPINRNLDWDQRPGGTNVIEMIFIFTMLRGVQLNAVGFRTNDDELERYPDLILEFVSCLATHGRVLQ